MHRFAKRVASIVVAGALALGGLTTCGANEPKSAEEVIARSTSNANASNCHSDVTMKYSMSLFGQALDLEMKLGMDTADDNAHVHVEIGGMSQLSKVEMYLEKNGDKYTQYSCANPDDSSPKWLKSEVDSAMYLNALTSSETLKNGEFSKVDNGYQISVSGEEFLNALSSSGINSTAQSLETLLGSDESVKQTVKDSKAVYTYDKDCYLTGITYQLDAGTSISTSDSSSSDSSTIDLSVSISLDLDAQIGNYGKVDAASATVPEDIKSKAVDETTATDVTSSLNEIGTSNSSSEQTQTNAA